MGMGDGYGRSVRRSYLCGLYRLAPRYVDAMQTGLQPRPVIGLYRISGNETAVEKD